MSGSNQVGLRWRRDYKDYVCGGYRIYRFHSGLRGAAVEWILTYRLHRIGKFPRFRDAKDQAWKHAKGES